MGKKLSNWIKVYIVDVLPGLTIATYFLGFIYNSFFYLVFGIDPAHYLSFGEMFHDIILPLFIISIFSFAVFFNLYIFHHYSIKKNIRRFLTFIIRNNYSNKTDLDIVYYNAEYHRKNNSFVRHLLFALFMSLLACILINEYRDLFMGYSRLSIIVPFLLSYFIFLPIYALTVMGLPRQIRLLFIIEAVIIVYFYAIIVFGYFGYNSGRFTRNHDTAKFEIKLTDGSTIDDKNYRFINQANDRVFLIEKNTNNNMIIGNDRIYYMKIDYLSLNDILK